MPATKKIPPLSLWLRLLTLFGNTLQERLYSLFSIIVLLVSSVIWALRGTLAHQNNADQLVDPHLFQDSATFHQAVFPSQHTFLIKWPIFYLVRLLHYSQAAYIGVTIAVALFTVAALAVIIYAFNKRPLVYATIYLILAALLGAAPLQPYAGAFIPVNMAMLTTRNIEYVVYIAATWLMVSAKQVRSRRFAVAVLLLGLLIASDKLFATLAIGGAVLGIFAYIYRRRWDMVSLMTQWFTGAVLSTVLGIVFLWLIVALHITHVNGQLAGGSYGLVSSPKSVAIGLVFGVLGFLSNFGANPAIGSTTIAQIPHTLLHNLFAATGPVYLITFVATIAGVWLTIGIMRASFRFKRSRTGLAVDSKLVVALVWSTLAAFMAFIFTNHDYVVDSRYLSIGFFVVILATPVYIGNRTWPYKRFAAAAVVSLLALIGSQYIGAQQLQDSQTAQTTIINQNQTIEQALQQHGVTTLVGDYWRVIPILQDTSLPVTPLQDCTQPRQTLTSGVWQPSLEKHSFAYLLSYGNAANGYPACSLEQVIKAYGRPNSSVAIVGSLAQPKESLLFYDRGINHAQPKAGAPSSPATVVPQAIGDMTGVTCQQKTYMNVVAHQDDDLLFMNPDTLTALRAKDCVRTVYMTAGDGGNSKLYWLSREQGSEAAYASMLGMKLDWVDRIAQMTTGEYVTIATPRNYPSVSLVFMHIPDGNLRGEGFPQSHFESLQKLVSGTVSTIHTIDGQSSYTHQQLVATIGELMRTFRPDVIRTQSTLNDGTYPDHSDHMAVGHLVGEAYEARDVTVPLQFYRGYPVHAMPVNVSGQELAAKTAAFLAYGQYDPNVCHSLAQCKQTPTYDAYLDHQYSSSR